MEIHRDDVVATGGLQHIGDKLGRDRRPTLVLLILPGVGEIRYDGGDAPGGGRTTGVDHDEELHQAIVNVARCGGLQDED